MTKRLFDFIVSLLGLILLSPILGLIAVWIKIEDPGPVFYRGERVGRGGNVFHIFKFRSMVMNAELLGGSSTAADDPRITRIGRLLRRYKLDEISQLLNVLVGHMSFVGPRPQVQWAVDLYTEEERALLSVRPGITDYASLVFRDEGAILRGSTDPDKDYLEKIAPHKIQLGLLYVKDKSLWIDLTIIMATLGAIADINPNWCLPEPYKNSQLVRSLYEPV